MKPAVKEDTSVTAAIRENHSMLLYPRSVSKRKLPVNLNSDHIPLFSHELERQIPPTSLLQFQDIKVSSDGVLFKGMKILPESFAFPWQLKEWKLRGIVKFMVNNHAFRRRRVVESPVLWITDHWSKGYFHWLTDVLTRLLVVRYKLNDFVLMLPWEYQAQGWVKSSLKAFGVEAVEFIDRNEVLECRRLFLPTHTAPSGNYNEELIQGVREILLSSYASPNKQQVNKRIYISRNRAPKRRIANEGEVATVVGKFGFETIRAEELSFEQQVEIFSQARYVISNHGAGLTNMLFMREGGSVLELRHQEDRTNNCYFALCSALNLDYFYQTCQPVNEADPHTADLFVDPAALEKNLGLLVAG